MVNWRKILQWLFVIFVIYIIIEVIRNILGGSLGFEEVVITLLVANLGYTFHLHSKILDINSKLSEHLGWHRGKKNHDNQHNI